MANTAKKRVKQKKGSSCRGRDKKSCYHPCKYIVTKTNKKYCRSVCPRKTKGKKKASKGKKKAKKESGSDSEESAESSPSIMDNLTGMFSSTTNESEDPTSETLGSQDTASSEGSSSEVSSPEESADTGSAEESEEKEKPDEEKPEGEEDAENHVSGGKRKKRSKRNNKK